MLTCDMVYVNLFIKIAVLRIRIVRDLIVPRCIQTIKHCILISLFTFCSTWTVEKVHNSYHYSLGTRFHFYLLQEPSLDDFSTFSVSKVAIFVQGISHFS